MGDSLSAAACLEPSQHHEVYGSYQLKERREKLNPLTLTTKYQLHPSLSMLHQHLFLSTPLLNQLPLSTL